MIADGKSINVVFRVDASRTIGSGHVMRCLTFANMLREYGVKAYFICREHNGHMAERIKAEGYTVLLLPLQNDKEVSELQGKYASWLGAALINDANETTEYIQKINPHWLVVDHFAIDSAWEQEVKSKTALKIMVIDGLANRKHECDILLDQTYSVQGKERWNGLVPAECKLFIGPKHAILRPEFIEAYRNLHRYNEKVRRIFLAFGGVDEPDATSKILEALVDLNTKDISVDVIIGASNPHRKNIVEKYANIEYVNIYVEPENIANLMVKADLAIGGGGTMMWERCLLKLPTLIISIADNQINLAKELHSIGAAVYIGDISTVTSESINFFLKELMNNKEKIMEIQSVSGKLMSQDNSSISKYLVENAK